MKKTFFLLLSAALLAALMGCQKPNEELPPALTDETTEQATETEKTPPKDTEALTEVETEPQTEPVTEPQTEPVTEPITEPVTEPETEQPTQNDDKYCWDYSIENLEVYLRDLWERQAEQGGDVGLNSQNHTVSVLVPVLKNDNYRLLSLDWVGKGENEALRWVYKPSGQFPVDYYDCIRVEVYVGITDHDEFIRNRLGLLFLNEEYRAGFQSRAWHFKMEGYSVSVMLPYAEYDLFDWVPFEKVFEYLDFEIVTYSPTAETNPVQ